MNSVEILGVIPARGGSKGIKHKNIKMLAGKPLIQYTIDAAQKSEKIDDFIVSTDSSEIADLAVNLGASVPFLRPSELATDTALAMDTIRHAVLAYEKANNVNVKAVMMLQPTSPLRTAKNIDDAINLFKKHNFDSCMSVVNAEATHPFKMKRIISNELVDFIETGMENPPRQSLPKVYIVNGAFYLVKRDILVEELSFKGNKCLPFEMDKNSSVNIDDELDFLLAELIINRNKGI